MADERTPQKCFPYVDACEDLDQLEFRAYYDSKYNNLHTALSNAEARRDALVKKVGDTREIKSPGEKQRVIAAIHMRVLADELEVAGFKYKKD